MTVCVYCMLCELAVIVWTLEIQDHWILQWNFKKTLSYHRILQMSDNMVKLVAVVTVTEAVANVRAAPELPSCAEFSNSQITVVHKQHKARTQHTTTACQVPTSGVMLLLCQVVTAFNSAGPSRAKMLLDASTIRDIQSGCFKTRHLTFTPTLL